jgi:hypothetical protein
MIVGLIALYIYLFGGGGVETLFDGLGKKDVEHAVESAETRSRILALSEQLGKDLAENRKEWDEQCDQLLKTQHDFESLPVDGVPGYWIGAPGKWKVREQDGNKVLAKIFRPKGLLRNATYIGPSSMSNFTIEADVQGGNTKRRFTDVGLIANGYTFDMMGNHQRLQIRTWPSENRIATNQDFPWEMGVWYRMKLRVDVTEEKAIVRGKAWPRGEEEPSDWSITVEDPYPIQSGSAGLVSYSPADAFFDNIKVTVND